MPNARRTPAGPLVGMRVIEVGGIGPGPFAAMLLADWGADVIRIDRPGPDVTDQETDLLYRGRRSVALDLSHPDGAATLLTLVESADALIEGFRPGVMEKLGVGPEACLERQPALVFGRMTGWGQSGPLAKSAGHDINYIALSGALHAVGRQGEGPVPPVNLLGDFGAGSLYLVAGLLAALWESRHSGRGQIVDAAIVDGAASLTTMLHGFMSRGTWEDKRGVNLLDTGVPWYDVYRTADDGWMSVGPLEPKFYAEFARLLSLPLRFHEQPAAEDWEALREEIAQRFATSTCAEWTAVFDGTDACVAPVLSMLESAEHPHLAHRRTFVDSDGVRQPAPAPRFSRTPGQIQGPPVRPGQHTRAVLADWNVPNIDGLIASRVAFEGTPGDH